MKFLKMTIRPYTHSCVQSWFEEHEDAIQHLLWSGKSPDLNIIEPMWSVLQSTGRRRFHLPSSLKQPEDVLHEGWYSIPLEAIQYLHESIPRWIKAVLQANGGPTPY
jgi:hypothetical protein